MCGFVGLWQRVPAVTEAVQRGALLEDMASTLLHRGPDDSGVWTDGDHAIGFAHRRLSIIDLSIDGRQPMHSACQRYVLSYNGEIYNYRQLRRELEDSGVLFRGASDSEVLLEAIAAWGLERTLTRANGMFAFALWDKARSCLFLARDRIGKKPLYFGWAGDDFVFASELKAIRRHPGFDPRLDRGALCLFLRYNYVPSPHCIYENIRKVSPGSFVCLGSSELDAKIPAARLSDRESTYFSAADCAVAGLRDPLDIGEAEAIDQLEDILLESTRTRMVSDVPLGALLSGGIDSSTVVSLMQACSTRPVKTFSLGFDQGMPDEARHAKRIAAHLGTDHTEIYAGGDDALAVVPKLATMYDEPFADSSQIPTFLICELARREVTVALSGDGGDELFCGYRRFMRGAAIWRFNSAVPIALRRAAASLLGSLGGPESEVRKAARDIGAVDALSMYRNRISKWREPHLVVIDGHEPPRCFFDAAEVLNDSADTRVVASAAHVMMLMDLLNYLPDGILAKVDRASMAVSLELRNPLLDHRVVEFAWKLPLSMKLRDGQGKWILRRLLDRHVPQELTARPKQGFGAPMRHWLSGPLREWSEDLLSRERLVREGVFEASVVRAVWQRFLGGKHKLHPHLWNVLMFQAWKQHWG